MSIRLRRSFFAVAVVALLAASVELRAQCGVPTAYTVTPAATGTQNWTDTSGGVWVPAGGYPGCTPGDSASNPGAMMPLTVAVNSIIPNPLIGLNWSAGQTIDVQPGGSLILSGPAAFSTAAKIQVSGGTLTIANGGSLTVGAAATFELTSGLADVQSGGTLTLQGTNTVTGGTLQLNGGTLTLSSAFTLGSGATLLLNGGAVNGTNALDNSGTVEQSGSDSTIFTTFNNLAGASGVVVNGGLLSLNGGGQGDAPFAINDGTLDFPTNTYTMGTGGTVSGPGTLSVTGGTLSIGGVTAPTSFFMNGGTLTGAGFLSVAGNFNWEGGLITGSGGTEIAGTGTGYFGGGVGTMALDGRAFNMYGYTDFSATTNPLELSNGATFAVYGTFEITADGSVTCNCSVPASFLVSPNGLVVKSGGAGTSVISPPTTNDSDIAVFSGILEIAGEGFHTGAFYSASGSTLRFSSSNTTLDSSACICADGDVDFPNGSNTTIDGVFSVFGLTTIQSGAYLQLSTGGDTTDFTMTGGAFFMDGPFAMYGTGTWSEGTIGGSSTFTVVDGATLTIDAATCVPTISNIEFINDGTINYTPTAVSGNHLELSNATLTNNGTFDMQNDAPIDVFSLSEFASGGCGASSAAAVARAREKNVRSNGLFMSPSYINNTGTWKKTGAGTSDIVPIFTNTGTVLAQNGVMNFTVSFTQNAGTTTLGAGGIQLGTMDLNGGTLDGAGTVDGDVVSSATVAPGNGTTGVINITGTYTQESGGTLAIGLEGPSPGQFDQLTVGGAATLDGAFTATLLNAYVPTAGTTWSVLTYASHSGAFASETLPPLITSSYTPTAFVLQAINPSADLSAGMTGPATVNAAASLSYVVTITNNGPSSTSGTITVTNTLPAGVTGATGSGSGWTCNPPAGSIITCTSTATIASASSFPTITFNMTAPANGGAISNSATVSSSFDANATNDTASVGTTVIAQADLQISKTGPNGITAGQNIVYTVTVTNNGPSSATNVIVSDPDPANATFVSNSGACTGPYPCNLGTLTSGQTATITSTYSTSPSFSGNVTNTASVTSSTADPNNANDSSTKITNVGAQADLQITKVGPPSATPNQNVVYTITFINNGPSPATSVVVDDPTPPGTAWISNTGACTSAFPCNIGNLAAGQSGTITATFHIPSTYTAPTVVNTASISSAVNDPSTANNSSSATTNVAQTADVGIVKTGPPTISPGQNIVYTVTVTNNGPSSAGSVVVSDTTPAGLTPVSNTGACTTAYPCNLGTLTSGQSATITSTYFVPANYSSPTIVNTANVTSAATDTNGANNTSTATTTVIAQADLAVTKSGPTSIAAGADITYTISVTNNGPLAASNVFVTDATPPGTTFVSNTGACTTPFPCALGTINAGQTVTITSTFNVPTSYGSGTVTNTASVSTSTFEATLTNNSSSTTATVTASSGPDVSITKTGPGGARQFDVINFTITVRNNGPGTASNVVVSDPQPAGMTWMQNSGACTTNFPCNLGSLTAGQTATITATYRFASVSGSVTNTATVTSTPTDPNTANNTSSANVAAGPTFTCPTGGPSLGAPGANAVLQNQNVTFSWGSVANAIGYILTITPGGGGTPIVINTGGNTATVTLAQGAYTWNVAAAGVESCRPLPSATSSFLICATLTVPPLASVVGESTTGQTYSVEWTLVEGATSYELQEASSPAFTNATSFTVQGNGRSFTKTAQLPTAFWYRVRAIASCNPNPGPFSTPISVVVVPVPVPTNHDPNVNVPNGSHTPVTWQIFVPGLPEGTTSFVATVDRPWLSVSPTSGIIPPAGMNFTISADPTQLTNGTWTGTLIVIYGTAVINEPIGSEGTTTFTAPISISLVTPVTPTSLTAASESAMIVPSVGHIAGIESLWRSDIRLANLASNAQKFQLVFNAGTGGSASSTKTTTLTVDGGATTALDDIVRNWYGIGSLGTSSNGLLTVQPLDAAGKPLTGLSNVAAVSSRTFNANAAGTLGQFIPAVPFAKFIGRGGAALSMQQLAQTASYRTNLGIVEAAGQSASVLVSAFDGNGAKLFELPLTLQAGEQKQLNGFLAANGVSSLENGRVEVRVTGGNGKVSAYASVVDNQSSDPILISGTTVDSVGTNRFVVPGIADFSGGGSNWRSDMRVFNNASTSQSATLTFYPSGNGTPITAPVTISAGEVEQLDDVLHSILGVTNLGGALHVTTAASATLVVTARTYDQTTKGTLGQFIPAVTANDAVALGGRALQILQAEESSRYRTNVGVVEVTGKDAVAEITVFLPDSKVTPVLQVPLTAFESVQIPVLNALGLGAVYNARISVRVIGGDGRVTAYGSVIDMSTKDPTFIPAQ